MTHAAIPTVYKGIQMRSRLEARWAAFFDLCTWQWSYESLDFNGWIPDFARSTEHPWESVSLFEIKPVRAFEYPADVAEKMERAVGADISKYDLWILGMDPSAMWRREPGQGWKLIDIGDWRPRWIAAGNPTQWKRPGR